MNGTIDYYNKNAKNYYQETVEADLVDLREAFASYLPNGARVMDMGCGSGRDVAAFINMGFSATGLDASAELVRLANEKLGVDIVQGDMTAWKSEEPYDGIWCCASLIHLNDTEKELFFNNLDYNLKKGGVIYISVKDGVEAGLDDKGRYINNYTSDELTKYLNNAGCDIVKTSITEDTMNRDLRWLNIIAKKNG